MPFSIVDLPALVDPAPAKHTVQLPGGRELIGSLLLQTEKLRDLRHPRE
jgi:hypothetical protein